MMRPDRIRMGVAIGYVRGLALRMLRCAGELNVKFLGILLAEA